MFRSVLTVVALLGLGSLAIAQEPLTHTKDTPEEVKKNLKDKKAILIDVRSADERADGYLKDSISMPIDQLQKNLNEAKLKEIAAGKIVYTHCAAGGRALKAGAILKKLGYDVRPLKPGYEDLVKDGFEKGEPKKDK